MWRACAPLCRSRCRYQKRARWVSYTLFRAFFISRAARRRHDDDFELSAPDTRLKKMLLMRDDGQHAMLSREKRRRRRDHALAPSSEGFFINTPAMPTCATLRCSPRLREAFLFDVFDYL